MMATTVARDVAVAEAKPPVAQLLDQMLAAVAVLPLKSLAQVIDIGRKHDRHILRTVARIPEQ